MNNEPPTRQSDCSNGSRYGRSTCTHALLFMLYTRPRVGLLTYYAGLKYLNIAFFFRLCVSHGITCDQTCRCIVIDSYTCNIDCFILNHQSAKFSGYMVLLVMLIIINVHVLACNH